MDKETKMTRFFLNLLGNAGSFRTTSLMLGGLVAVLLALPGSVVIGDTATAVSENFESTATVAWDKNSGSLNVGVVTYDYLRPDGETYTNHCLRLRYGNGDTRTALGTFGDTVSLGSQVGDSLELTFDFAYSSSAGGNLRFGLYNSNSTPGGTSSADDFGYFAAFGAGSNSNAAVIMEAGDGYTYNYVACYSSRDLTYANLTSANQIPTINTLDTRYSASMTLTRTAGGTDVVARIHDATGTQIGYASGSDASSAYTSFDEILFGVASGYLHVDNMELNVTTVPEPATMALLASGGLLLLRRRRH